MRSAELASISTNTPFEAMTLPARVTATFLRGRITARNAALPEHAFRIEDDQIRRWWAMFEHSCFMCPSPTKTNLALE